MDSDTKAVCCDELSPNECRDRRTSSALQIPENQARVEYLERQLKALEVQAKERISRWKTKYHDLESEIRDLRSDNKASISRNVELQKGADTLGSRVHDLRVATTSLQARLDNQYDINRNLASEKSILQAKLEDKTCGSGTADFDHKLRKAEMLIETLNVEVKAQTMLLHESCKAFGWYVSMH